jgi:hypothetical protein
MNTFKAPRRFAFFITTPLVVCHCWLVQQCGQVRAQSSAAQPAAKTPSESQRPKTAAPRFTVRCEGERWSLVTPAGKPFFSMGVCCVVQGPSRDEYDPENPSYARWRYYDSPAAWADSSLRRLADWGFTTVGGWSDYETLLPAMRAKRPGNGEGLIGITPVLHLGATAGAPWWDMWDEKITARMEEVARQQIVAVRDDPRLIGYYSDNEMGWWNATLFKMTLEHAPTSGQRQRLIALLRETYGDDWQKLSADFEPGEVGGWDELARGGRLHLRPGGNGIRVMRRFLAMLAERYYQLAHDIVRKHDPRGLILGDRYQSFYYPEVSKAAARHVDVISTNLNAHWNDGTFLRCYLDTLHKLTGKPILVSEFYLAATENRSGNRNTSGVFPVAATQRERAAATKRTLAALVKLPYVVGADWFQYADEPTHGREDGENFNFGLVDIHDRPYEEVANVFKEVRNAEFGVRNVGKYEGRSTKDEMGKLRRDASQGIPPAPADPFARFEVNTALAHWDRERGFVPATSEFPVADLYACWSPQAIYLGLYAWDAIDEHFYAGGYVPKADRAVWTVAPEWGRTKNEGQRTKDEPANTPLPLRGVAGGGDGNSGLIRITLGSGREALINDPKIRVESLSGTKLTVRLIAAIELPASRFGKDKFAAGDTVAFSSRLVTHARAYEVEWQGKFTLAK